MIDSGDVNVPSTIAHLLKTYAKDCTILTNEFYDKATKPEGTKDTKRLATSSERILSDLRTKLAETLHAVQELSPPFPYINDLNDNILSCIFFHCTAEEEAEEDREGRHDSEAFPIHSSEILTQVSHRWRILATENASLWTRIRIDSRHGPQKVNMWLKRSK
ncbi:hypothetical protein FRB95_011342 [Tulasnella sp. JGI-2019a]|nr:hypothetical protein FRB95_011342 [Tulasnella sp. JGI-2019a]